MTQNAIKDAMGPEAGIRGASPQNPLYVTVVRDLFGGGGRGNDPTTPPIVTDVPGKTSRFGRAVRFAGKVTAIGAITAAAAEAGNELRGGRGGLEFGLDYPVDFYKRLWRGMTRSHRQRDPREIIMGQYRHGQLSRQDAQRQVAVAGRQLPQLQRLSEIINRFSPRQPVTTVLGIQRRHREMIHGRAQIVLDIRLEKDGKIRTKRVHVPVDMFKNGVYPSNRGNPRTNRKVN